MAKKKMQKIDLSNGFVFSTNPDFELESEAEESQTLEPNQQILHVLIDRKQRAGKEVTIVQNFVGNDDDLKELGKLLKQKCGGGGGVKDGDILIQGNHRDKIMAYLQELGYKTKRVGG